MIWKINEISPLKSKTFVFKRTKFTFHFIATSNFIDKTALKSVHCRIELWIEMNYNQVSLSIKSFLDETVGVCAPM